MPERNGEVHGWQRYAPLAAVAWSLVYGALGVYWTLSGRGFPFAPGDVLTAPAIGRFGPAAAWMAVIIAGFPAAAIGTAMLRPVRNRALRPILLSSGLSLAGLLLLLMTSLDLLIKFGYIPYALRSLSSNPDFARKYLVSLAQWATIHQLLCLTGGFLWLAATVCYARRSIGACLRCGRRDGAEGWQSPAHAARWGRVAVCVAMVAPLFYAVTRYAWALGVPLGISEQHLRSGQATGTWTSGLFLANFGLAGAILMLGLVQRWGELFPRWIPGLAGHRVPVAMAVVPASLVSVLLIVGGVAIWSSLGTMAARLTAGAADGTGLAGGIVFVLGPTLLFPLWGASLAVAASGYYYRRRGACVLCGRGAPQAPATDLSMQHAAAAGELRAQPRPT